ncbi:MAG TPA: polymer-forming cytoskeletal protein [Thermoanaerobaculia bacterium]
MAIFGKSDSTPQEAPAPERAPGAAPSASGGASSTVLGPKVRFVGDISGDEDVVIHGRCEGNIRVSRRVTVAGSGEVKGDVHARTIVVGGRVQGLLQADEKAELLASASVQGNVHAPKVIIAEGAQLQGSVAMSADAESPSAPRSGGGGNKAEEH